MRRVRGAMHHRVDGELQPMPNVLEKRQHGQCEYCLHYGTDCRCHTRKTQPISQVHQSVYLVIEDEPESEFPSVVIGAYATKVAAEERVAYERKVRGLQDQEAYEESDLTWEVEKVNVWPERRSKR